MAPRLSEIEGITCPYPEGAFYLFPDISELGVPSAKFSQDLFAKEKVRCASGSGYGENGEGHVRFALVRPVEVLADAHFQDELSSGGRAVEDHLVAENRDVDVLGEVGDRSRVATQALTASRRVSTLKKKKKRRSHALDAVKASIRSGPRR